MSSTTFNHSFKGHLWMGGGTTWADGRSRSSATVQSQTEVYVKMVRGSGDNTDRARGFVFFDTSGLADNCTIHSAIFRAKCEGVFSNDFSGSMTLVPGTTAGNSSLTGNDYNISNFGSSLGSKALSGMSLGVDFDINLSAFTAINKTGLTKLGVMETHDYNDDNSMGDGSVETRFQDTGSVRLIVTWTTPPAVTTGGATDIEGTSATLAGTVTDQGGGSVSERGVCWSTSSNPTTSDNKATDGDDNISVSATGLVKNTTYHYRAYVITENSTQYGSDQTFTTDVEPTVSTTAITDLSVVSATSGGNVTSDGNSTVLERGVCYKTSTGPTTSDTKVVAAGTTGSFVSLLTGLTPGKKYYLRAFARNAVGTAYGSEISFQTYSPALLFMSEL